MAGTEVSAATLELLGWIGGGRTYAEAMETWGSWCPRHAAWEDALAGGLVRVLPAPSGTRVELTRQGRATLDLTARGL